jgi:hypothetical protein
VGLFTNRATSFWAKNKVMVEWMSEEQRVFVVQWRSGGTRSMPRDGYGITSVPLIKETDRSFVVNLEGCENVLNSTLYFPERMTKSSYNVFYSYDEALAFCFMDLQKRIQTAEIKLAHLHEERVALLGLMERAQDAQA